MKKNISKIITNIYGLIFQERITPDVKLFIKNLGFVSIGYGIAAFGIFSFQVIAGRILGPGEYGKYVLVDSIAMFLHILMVLGFSVAAVKYSAQEKNYKEKRKIISTSYWTVIFLSIFLFFLFFIFSSQFSKFFSVSSEIFQLAVIFALFYSFYILTTNILRGLYEMKKLAVFRAGYALGALIVLGLLIINKYNFFTVPIFAISFAYLVVFVLITFNLRKYISFQLNRFWLDKFFRYGTYAIIGGVGFTLLPHLNKILVNKFLTITNVGIYNAYYFSSIGIVMFISAVFITVFFPTASMYPKKKPIFKKIKQIIPYLFLGGLPILFGVGLIILSLYGGEYPMDYFLMLLFVFSGILIAIYGLYNWLFCSDDVLGVKLASVATVILAFLNIISALYLIPLFGLYGAVISVSVSYFIGINFLLLFERKIL